MENIMTFLVTITTAISNCSLYSKNHPSVDEFTRRAAKVLDILLREAGRLDIMHVENKLIINEMPFAATGLQDSKLMNRLKRKRVSYVKFLPAVTVDELKQFVSELVEIDKDMPQFPHIKTGVLDVEVDEYKEYADFDSDDISSFVSRQVQTARNIYNDFSQARKPDMPLLYDMMKNFVVAFKKRMNILQLLSDAKSREEYTYIHATNVSALSIFQMEGLGMKEKSVLCDVGIAGLLHDVGKLFISGDPLEKRGPLDEKEWEEIKRHPLHGAKYLYPIEGLPHLATVVAFQHHFRKDGRGYPPLRTMSIDEHICSEIVTISDVFDALRSVRPYRKDLHTQEVLLIMKKDSAAFNPVLLQNFMRRLHEALPT
ncbi:MAG TPA: HD domain-containing phosphohydrolase [Thermodesulfovibrionales bacterium]|nr:HD domain-containing phosphohydrolase [Thermodesulfovibrionales bacterium]